MCAHSPTEVAPACEVNICWAEFNKHIAATPKRRYHLIGVDANARLGIPESSLIGGPQHEHESPNGTRLRLAMEEHRLAAVTVVHLLTSTREPGIAPRTRTSLG